MIETIKITKLKGMKGNPRTITNVEFNNLKNSIKEFGCVAPIIINKDNTVISGHQRLLASIELGFTEIDCIRTDLNEEKAKILNIALNKISGDWDPDKLSKFVEGIGDLELTGFSEQELKDINIGYDYEDLSDELEELEVEEDESSVWVAKFKNQKELDKCEKVMNKIKSENKLGGFSSDDCNGLILKKLCEKYENTISRK